MRDSPRRFIKRRGTSERVVRPSRAFGEDAFRQAGFLPTRQDEIDADVVLPPFPCRSLDQADQPSF